MKLFRNEEGTLVSKDDDRFYVRQGEEQGFTEDEMTAIHKLKGSVDNAGYMHTEQALEFARKAINIACKNK